MSMTLESILISTPLPVFRKPLEQGFNHILTIVMLIGK